MNGIGMLLAAVALAAAPKTALVEVAELASGSVLQIERLNPEDTLRETYALRMPSGLEVTLPGRSVARTRDVPENRLEYVRRAPRAADTVAGQLQLAAWCEQHNLPRERKQHLRRVLELDPDHEETRRVLGYRLVQGEWLTRDEEMAQKGYFRHGGRWMTQQEIDLEKAKRGDELAVKKWRGQLKRWRRKVYDTSYGDARATLLSIDDTYAIPALAELLKEDPDPALRLLYIETLGYLGTEEALRVLVDRSLRDGNEEVRLSCVDEIKAHKFSAAARHYAGALTSNSRTRVRRAAVALAELKDPRAVPDLISALITTHTKKTVTGNPGSLDIGFSSLTGGGMSVGGGGVRIKKSTSHNQEVLDALVVITGVNFGFHVDQWRHWYQLEYGPQDVDVRRDE